MEHIKTNDTVYFSTNFYHPVSGYSVASDTTPRWFVYEDNATTSMLDGVMTVRSDIIGSYYGTFDASGVSGFESFKFYDVQVSGSVSNISGMESVKTFVLDDIYDVNIVQVSGIAAAPGTAQNVNVTQVSGEYVHIDGFKSDLTTLNDLDATEIRSAVGINSANLDTQLADVSGVLMRAEVDTNALAAEWKNGGRLDLIIDDILFDTNDLQLNQPNWITWPYTLDNIADSVWNEIISGHTTTGSVGEALITASGNLIGMRGTDDAALNSELMSVSGVVSSLDQDIYFANIKYIKDSTNNKDEFGVQWFKNDQPVTSGELTDPAISVYNTSDGSILVDSQSMAYASPNIGVVRYDSASIMTSGEPYLIETSGTIDAGVKTWKSVVGIDVL